MHAQNHLAKISLMKNYKSVRNELIYIQLKFMKSPFVSWRIVLWFYVKY